MSIKSPGVGQGEMSAQASALIADLFLLRSSLRPEEFHWSGVEADKSRWQSILERYEAGTLIDACATCSGETLAYSVDLLEDPPLRLAAAVPLDEGAAQEPPTLSAPTLGASEWLSSAKEQLEAAWSSSHGQENRNFDAYTQLSSWITDHHPPAAANPDAPLGGAREATQQSQGPVQVPIFRQIFYTHHLISPIKQKELSAWAAELDTWLLVKLGYPGFLILEGPRSAIQGHGETAKSGDGGALDLSRRIKGMQWHRLNDRCQVEYEVTVDVSTSTDLVKQALLQCPLAKACIADAPNSAWTEWVQQQLQSDAKMRACIRKTEAMSEIVDA